MSHKKPSQYRKYRNKELERISSNHLLHPIPWAKMKCIPMTVPVFIAHSKYAKSSAVHPVLRRHDALDQTFDQTRRSLDYIQMQSANTKYAVNNKYFQLNYIELGELTELREITHCPYRKTTEYATFIRQFLNLWVSKCS